MLSLRIPMQSVECGLMVAKLISNRRYYRKLSILRRILFLCRNLPF